MTDIHSGNIAFKWTSTFFIALQNMGIRHIVISPGSRSTPLTLAAASNNHFHKHVILDERSAAFTALGIGKATNVPAVLICTSGTALANYYPAVIEARQSGVPLILATADRPPYLRATGANQAIDQLKLFGNYPVFFHEVGEPRNEAKDLERLALLAQQAFTLSREKRGPVHLNFPFRKPLEPESDFLDNLASDQEPNSNKLSVDTQIEITLSEGLYKRIAASNRPLIMVGPLAPGDDIESISNLSTLLGCPVFSESSLDHDNSIHGFTGFLRNRDIRSKLKPDLILRFGFQPTSKSLEMALSSWKLTTHVHFASTDEWQDETSSGADRIAWMGNPIDFGNIPSSPTKDWLDEWKSAQHEFNSHYSKIINKETNLTDGAIYNHFTPQIDNDHFVAVSNSFPARDIHLFGNLSPKISLFMNRGVSGIDGVTSTAMGVSLGLQKPGVLFTGDLAFLHDTNAQLNHSKLSQPLAIILINNGGGSIFRMLPIERHEQYFETYFETPQSVDIGKLVAAYDIDHQHINSLEQLREFSLTDWMQQHSGLSVIECRTDADASMRQRKELWNFSQ